MSSADFFFRALCPAPTLLLVIVHHTVTGNECRGSKGNGEMHFML